MQEVSSSCQELSGDAQYAMVLCGGDTHLHSLTHTPHHRVIRATAEMEMVATHWRCGGGGNSNGCRNNGCKGNGGSNGNNNNMTTTHQLTQVGVSSIAGCIGEAMGRPPICHAFSMVGKSFDVPTILFHLLASEAKKQAGGRHPSSGLGWVLGNLWFLQANSQLLLLNLSHNFRLWFF